MHTLYSSGFNSAVYVWKTAFIFFSCSCIFVTWSNSSSTFSASSGIFAKNGKIYDIRIYTFKLLTVEKF